MASGKLYQYSDNQLVSEVKYQCHYVSPTNWWGELTTVRYVPLNEMEWYVLEVEGGRRGKCHLKKRVNGPVSGLPPRYIYHFVGTGDLQ